MFCDEHGTLDYCPECLKNDEELESKEQFRNGWNAAIEECAKIANTKGNECINNGCSTIIEHIVEAIKSRAT